MRRAIRLNGIDSLVVTKLDVLSGFETLKVAVSYELDGREIFDLPPLSTDAQRLIARYETLPGWKQDLKGIRSYAELPAAAKNYLARLEQLAACKISGISLGPDRTQTVILNDALKKYSALS